MSGADLDMCYIHDQVIAMGLPAQGLEALYRNPIEEVLKCIFFTFLFSFIRSHVAILSKNFEQISKNSIKNRFVDSCQVFEVTFF